MYTEQKIILATDEFNYNELIDFVKKFGNKVFGVKIHNLFDQFGPKIVSELQTAGAKRVWVDAKLHDIPNTVKLRAKAIAGSGCNILSVHASGGEEMMRAAKEGFGSGKVYAVTALTSLTEENLQAIYNVVNTAELVKHLAKLAKNSGVDGLVCSPKEISLLKSDPDLKNLELVVPGIRSVGVDVNDQQRFGTPTNALKAGANFLVVGRQLTKATDKAKTFDDLEKELANILN